MVNYVQCTAKSKRTGERCKARAVTGSKVCYHHGGRTPKGIASPHTKSGRYSKYLAPDLADRFISLENDEDLLNLKYEIVLLDVLISENLSALQPGESADFWDAALQQVIDARKSYMSENYAGLEKALNELEALCDHRRLHFAAEKEIREKVKLRKELTESRRKHLIETEQVVTSEQAMLLVSGLLESVRRNVKDRNALTAIQTDFIQFTHSANRQRVDAGSTDSE
jgi:hypothetical protein